MEGAERGAVVHVEHRAHGGGPAGAHAKDVPAAPAVDVVVEEIKEQQGRQLRREGGLRGGQRARRVEQGGVGLHPGDGLQRPWDPVQHRAGHELTAPEELGHHATGEVRVARAVGDALELRPGHRAPARRGHAPEVQQPTHAIGRELGAVVRDLRALLGLEQPAVPVGEEHPVRDGAPAAVALHALDGRVAQTSQGGVVVDALKVRAPWQSPRVGVAHARRSRHVAGDQCRPRVVGARARTRGRPRVGEGRRARRGGGRGRWIAACSRGKACEQREGPGRLARWLTHWDPCGNRPRHFSALYHRPTRARAPPHRHTPT